MDWGSTLSGVPIHRSSSGVTATPSTDSTTPDTRPAVTVVWMVRLMASISPAP